MNENRITDKPYAKWLERALSEMSSYPVHGITLAAVTDTGEIYTDYYEVSMADKLVISGVIHQDATLDMLAANGIINYEEDEEDNETNGSEEE